MQKELNNRYRFDPDNGVIQKRSTSKPVTSKTLMVSGRRYPASHLMWLHVHGYLPDSLSYKNGDTRDIRITNLRLPKAPFSVPPTTKAPFVGLRAALREEYTYNSVRGWLKKGDRLITTKTLVVGGRRLPVKKVIWLYVYGYLPVKRVISLDGDDYNLKLKNLSLRK